MVGGLRETNSALIYVFMCPSNWSTPWPLHIIAVLIRSTFQHRNYIRNYIVYLLLYNQNQITLMHSKVWKQCTLSYQGVIAPHGHSAVEEPQINCLSLLHRDHHRGGVFMDCWDNCLSFTKSFANYNGLSVRNTLQFQGRSFRKCTDVAGRKCSLWSTYISQIIWLCQIFSFT